MRTPIVAIDPGTTESAVVVLTPWVEAAPVPYAAILPNASVLEAIRRGDLRAWRETSTLAVEMVASYGMPVGREVFETVLWAGRFLERWDGPHDLVYRRDVKLALCGSSKANDATIRTAILDRFGPGRERAVGTKKKPGPLYGIRSDLWAALGVALTVWDRKAKEATA